jgi:hypothetical protein
MGHPRLLLTFIALAVASIGLIVYAVNHRHTATGGIPTTTMTAPAVSTTALTNTVKANADEVGRYGKLELTVDLSAKYQNPYDPNEVALAAEFTSPSGKKWNVDGFYDGEGWKIRFSPNEVGHWSYQVSLKDRYGASKGTKQPFNCIASDRHGWIKVASDNKRYFMQDDGTSFYGVGAAYPWNVTPEGLDLFAASGANILTYWNGNYDGSGSGGGVKQLMSVNSGIGQIDQDKSKRMEELVDMFEKRNLHMSFTIWPHDSLAQHIDWPKAWSKNAFSAFGDAVHFYEDQQNWHAQEILYRYIIARWGYSEVIGLWDIIDEVDGTDGWMNGNHNKVNEWAKKVQYYFVDHDPYRHPTSGSMSGGAESYWTEGYQIFDVSDRENYYDFHYSAYPADAKKRWDSFEKPLIIGETGNITDTAAFHGALWSSLASGLSMTPIWWSQEKIDSSMYEQMKYFANFTAGIDFAHSHFKPAIVETSKVEVQKPSLLPLVAFADTLDWNMENWPDANKDVAADHPLVVTESVVDGWAMSDDKLTFGWMTAKSNAIGGKQMILSGFTGTRYKAEWFDTWTGKSLGTTEVITENNRVTLTAPQTKFTDAAFKLTPS